jgi:predicted DsbA family dithiol-disulfide isomerase
VAVVAGQKKGSDPFSDNVASMMSNTINIEIVSDFVCPWCLVGKRRLEKALEQRPDLDINLIWRPFQLNPDMPREGQNRRKYYLSKFGEERLKELRQFLGNAGAEEGIVFCDEPDAMAPNSLSAHVLMYWAAMDQKIDSDALAEKLFHAHHVACENIGDHEVLVRIAAEAGMDEARVMAKLTTGDDEDTVKGHIQQAVAQDISGVPFFIINNQYGISGAQPAEVLVSAISTATKTL